MSNQLHNELKKEFQLERLILFSDAVFAIAITLLVLEIKVPEIPKEQVTEELLRGSLAHMIPKFVGFLISFFVIGLYWTIHHQMFGFVINYTRKLMWLNLLFLLAVALMPFSTAFYSEYVLRLLKMPVIIYVTNIVFLGLMTLFIWQHITDPKLHLTAGLVEEEKRYFTIRAITVPVMFITTALVYLLIAPKVAIFIPPFIPLIIRATRNMFILKPKVKNAESSLPGSSSEESVV
jgi:uncharacterized membrane protein